MRIPSVYGVYRQLFGYPHADPRIAAAFGRSIAEALPVIEEILTERNYRPVGHYQGRRYARQLTLDFLGNFVQLAETRGNVVQQWVHRGAEVALGREYFSGTRVRGLVIECPYLLSPRHREVIVPTFGPARDMVAELGVFLRLIDLGTMEPGFPDTVRTVTYWNLRDGLEQSADIAEVPLADRVAVVQACRELVHQRR